MVKTYKKQLIIAFLFIITLIAFFYRFRGINLNTPFWVDEYSSAHQARYILKHGLNVFTQINKPEIYFEDRNITTHFLIAGFFKLFGQTEGIARMPMVIIGSFIPLVLFLLSRKIFGLRTGIVAALLATFSYFEITWSRQARGYIIQQLLTVLLFYFYMRIYEKKQKTVVDYVPFAVIILLGIITHPTFYLAIAAIGIHYAATRGFQFHILKKNPLTYILAVIFLFVGYHIGIFQSILLAIGKINNVWYYHAFLWREYGLLTFLALLGIGISILMKKRFAHVMSLYMAIHLFFFCFLLGPYISRYLAAMFPFLFVFTAYTLVQITDLLFFQAKVKYNLLYVFTPIALALFIVANGDKFVSKPKQFYSVNHDFREIALIDYHQVYDLMKRKGELQKGKTAVVETWPDRMHWYLGQDYFYAYELKWKNPGMINGIPTGTTPFFFNENGEKMTTRYKEVGLINEVHDLKKAMEKYPQGFMFIDDATLPKDVIDYAEKNLKKELYLDHYTLDDNPYSIWPATLYSWGFEK